VTWAAVVRPNARRSVERPITVVSVPELAKAVAASGIVPVLDLPAEELAAMTDRLRPTQGMSVSGLVHALHFFGANVTTPPGSLRAGSAPLLDVLLDVPRAAEMFGGASILATTRYGVRAPLYTEGLLGTNQSGAMAHRGQFLSVLGSLGVPGDRSIRLADGSSRPVSAICDDLMANFAMDGEIAWDAIALAFYAKSPDWTNKFGRTFSFDEIARELNSRDPTKASCGGTHDLIALTFLIKINQFKSILSGVSRDQAIADLSRRVAQVKESQLEDGSWNLRWHRVEPTRAAADQVRTSVVFSENALIVSGHLMEWMILLPDSFRPDAEVYRRGGTWLAASLKTVSNEPSSIDKLYCPLTHATRSLRFLSRIVEPPHGP